MLNPICLRALFSTNKVLLLVPFKEAVKISKQIVVAVSSLRFLVFVLAINNLQVQGFRLRAFCYWDALPGGKVQNSSKVLNPVPRSAPAPCWWKWVQVKLVYDS